MRNTQIKKKKKPKPNIHCKSLNQKPQITKSNITKANLETKTSIEQHSQHCNTSQQTDRASLHRRSVSQHNSSSSPQHITSGFGHRRSLTGSDRRSPIGHVARRSAQSRRLLRHSLLVACYVVRRSSFGLLRRPSLGLLYCLSLSLLRCSLNLSLKVFHNFSLSFFSLTLLVSLSLYLKN